MLNINRNYIPIHESEAAAPAAPSGWFSAAMKFLREGCALLAVAVVFIIGIIVVICGLFVLLYVVGVVFDIFILIINTAVETTIVAIFGQELYNKNFPSCSETRYSGNNCYTTANTYCY